jgi:pimeloyl-[acyl-carrier protein] methyl ester esterase
LNIVFTKIAGQGEPLLVLHGWGMNHNVWSTVSGGLERSFRVTWVDLPGHGNSMKSKMGELDQVVEQIIELLKEPTHVLGWSLGGLIAQRLAERFPKLVYSLTLVSTSPSFLQRQNWSNAMPKAVMQGFINNLQNDYKTTIQHFLALQFMGVLGVKGVKETVRQIKKEIIANPPDQIALQNGLDILYKTDLRTVTIRCPKYWIFGRLDKLVPVEVTTELFADNDSIYIIDKAGHAPFISHPDEFVEYVTECISTVGINK